MEFQIQINKSKSGSGYVYEPSTIVVMNKADVVFFTNNTSTEHWPGLDSLDPPGTPRDPVHYLMQKPLPANGGRSSAWTPTILGTVTYADSLDGSPSKPTGTITITVDGNPPVIA